jgi:uncharacterized pyridoxamine 5'-phosphate oxidase family protein
MEEHSMNEVCEFLKRSGVYYLATDEGGQPRVRPFGTAHIFDGGLYIQTGRKKPVFQQIVANPRVEICAFDKGQTLRVAATLVVDDRLEAEKSLLDAYPSLSGAYQPGDGNNVVLRLTDATATFSAMNAEPRVVKF